ncbi:TauD/TfdA family dioxygenase [Mitsuaria sp. WAJ17]|uniref:TauD/TfdA family dioxygenase n=1 Tax=Mitsuaria sp. WAJ17 TaxID=2761452 RepID=UPI0016047314|nr:TauD/TfdA family dioxygenase [Mitsuaria sp. WAJ17]MBB2487888.1 TauD/TfdA family dioxygenase [Mitsuaria sp. WAJ17]
MPLYRAAHPVHSRHALVPLESQSRRGLHAYDERALLRLVRSVDPGRAPALWEHAGAAYLANRSPLALRAVAALRRDEAVSLHLTGLGLPVDIPLPPTPYQGQSDPGSITLALLKLFGLVRHMGARVVAYTNEDSGRIYRDVAARQGAHDEVSSQGWAQRLPWHTDCAYRPLTDFDQGTGFADGSPAPRWLVFCVVHDKPAVPLTLVPATGVIARLAPQHRDALLQPEFDITSPQSFGPQLHSQGLPLLLSDGRGGHFVRLNELGCTGRTARAREGLAALSEALQDPPGLQRIALRTGDMIVLDNWRAFHMRSAYTPNWNGRDRWLVRVYAVPHEVRGLPVRKGMERIWK